MKHTLLAALFFTLTITAVAQQKETPSCRVRVHVVKHSWNNPTEVLPTNLSPNQAQWWTEKGQKKFPYICFVATAPEADYQLTWAEKRISNKDVIYVPSTTTTAGTVRDSSGGRAGTYNETSVTRTPVESEDIEYWVQLRLTKLTNGAPEFLPAYSEERPYGWTWSSPDKIAFERSIKQLSKLTKRLNVKPVDSP